MNEKFQSGTLVVGKVMSEEGAETRLLEIWAEMNEEAAPRNSFLMTATSNESPSTARHSFPASEYSS